MSNNPIGINPDNRSTLAAKKSTGWQVEGVDFKEFNEGWFKSITDHVWGYESQVKSSNTATFYTDVSGNPLDKNDAAVTINDDDKILIAHDVTATANQALDCGGKKVTIEMSQGVTWDLDTYDLTLGGSGDSIGGDIRLIGTGTLTIEKSNGLRVTHTSMTVNSLDGDIIINNDAATKSAKIEYIDLIAKYISVTTLDVDIRKLQLLSVSNVPLVIENIDQTFDITSDRYGGSEKASTWYQIWLAATAAGVLEKMLVPDITGTADGTSAGKLIDSTATFLTDLVTAEAIVYNHTDDTKTRVTIDAAAEGSLDLDDDIFVSGETYTIHIVNPTFTSGYIYSANIGAVYNDSGSDFDYFYQTNDDVSIIPIAAVTGTQTTYTTVLLSAILPITAIKSFGYIDLLDNDASVQGWVSSDTTMTGEISTRTRADGAITTRINAYFELMIKDVVKLYYRVEAGATSMSVYIAGWKLGGK